MPLERERGVLDEERLLKVVPRGAGAKAGDVFEVGAVALREAEARGGDLEACEQALALVGVPGVGGDEEQRHGVDDSQTG